MKTNASKADAEDKNIQTASNTNTARANTTTLAAKKNSAAKEKSESKTLIVSSSEKNVEVSKKEKSDKPKTLSAKAKAEAKEAKEAEKLAPIDKPGLLAPLMVLPKVSEPPADMVLKGIVNRQGQKMINPLEIVVNWKSGHNGRNPRVNFGSHEKWEAWQKDIATNGFAEPVLIYKDKEDGRFYLRHGYRRMKAMLEVLAMNNPEYNWELVPVMVVEKDEVAELRDHFTLNTSEPLNEIEMADGLRRYMKLTGQKMIRPVARQLGIEYVKAINLYKFIKKASSEVIKAVNEGVITFSGAKTILKRAKTPAEQSEMIKIGRENAKGTKTGKIRTNRHVPAIKAEIDGKAPLDVKIFNILGEVATSKNVDNDFVNRMLMVLNAIRDGKDTSEVEELLAPIALAS